MTTSQNTFSDEPDPSPLLIGVLVDVSCSMQRNWHNKDGKKLPRIEMIRDALNRRIKKEMRRRQAQKDSLDEIALFCLGMGFQAPIHLTDVQLSYGREHHLGNAQMRTMTDLVCDILALDDILPSREKLTEFKTQLNEKWLQCSKDILDRSMIVEDVYADLVEYVQNALYVSAMEKLHRSIRYKLANTRRFPPFAQALQKSIKEIEEKITVRSQTASAEYAADVSQRTDRDFKANTNKYVALILHHLETFAQSYTASTLQALTLGFNIAELVHDLDENRAIALARKIQKDLEAEVKKHIALALTGHERKLLKARRNIAASLNRKEVRRLTERFIRKSGWDILRTLIEETVFALFAEQFEVQAKANFPYWIRLSAEREVVHSLKRISNLLPDIVEEHIYSKNVMFGSTPFQEALDKAAIRLIDTRYSNWRKVLIVISDGEFELASSSLVTVNLLKRRDVAIISCLIAERNIITRLVKHSSKSWPSGAQLMLEIASEASEQGKQEIKWKDRESKYALTDEKLCFQINQSSILEDVIETVFDSYRYVS